MTAPLATDRGPAAKIALRGLRKSFGAKVVLDGLDLEIAEGESVAIIGGSGTGKSVLLKHIIGLVKPDAGTVEIEGVDLATLSNRDLTRFRRDLCRLWRFRQPDGDEWRVTRCT